MDSVHPGDLVQVADESREQAGIVFDTPSPLKVIVAVVDARRGPLFRTVHPKALSERTAESPDDAALRHLIRRTPAPTAREGRGGTGPRQARAGHTRPASHRATGK